jgi:hypothetical protein
MGCGSIAWAFYNSHFLVGLSALDCVFEGGWICGLFVIGKRGRDGIFSEVVGICCVAETDIPMGRRARG